MDVTKILEADHRQVARLFGQIDKAEGDERQPLVDELVDSLTSHMELEERVLYPRMASVTGDEAVEEGNTEHALARKGLEDVVALAPDAPGFGAALEAVKGGIEHHVEEEESEIFPKLRKDGKILDAIATPFMQTRVELGLPVEASALSTASTKSELVDEAQGAGIDGASSMTKDQLAEALVAKMAS